MPLRSVTPNWGTNRPIVQKFSCMRTTVHTLVETDDHGLSNPIEQRAIPLERTKILPNITATQVSPIPPKILDTTFLRTTKNAARISDSRETTYVPIQ